MELDLKLKLHVVLQLVASEWTHPRHRVGVESFRVGVLTANVPCDGASVDVDPGLEHGKPTPSRATIVPCGGGQVRMVNDTVASVSSARDKAALKSEK